MLNYLWAFMILAGIAWGALQGNLNTVTQAALDSAKEAVTLGITMLGVMSFWTGILEIGRGAGLIERCARIMRPVLRFLFPRIPENHPSKEHIATNVIANMLGLGMAATPAGLEAMKELANLETERKLKGRPFMPPDTASNEMCTFLILNISSLQLIPITMIAYRSQYGSVNPTAIIGPALVATCFSALAGAVFAKIMDRQKRT